MRNLIGFLLIIVLCVTGAVNATEIHQAAKDGDYKKVESILKADPKQANAISKRGYAPLHVAAKSGNIDIAKLLISHGANVNALSTNSGGTPLFAAISGNHLEMVKLLISNGAKVNIKNKDGVTPLKLAEDRKFKNIADYLRSHGAK